MPSEARHVVTSHSPDETCAIAQRLAAGLRIGDTVLLNGDVGAGKTHFARCIIQCLQRVPDDVPSPTYTLVQSYGTSAGEIWHADLYRLSDTNEVIELGLLDAFSEAICLVEWPDRMGDLAPSDALRLTMEAGEGPETRQLTFQWRGQRWDNRMKGLGND